jgi:hypothetical protein
MVDRRVPGRSATSAIAVSPAEVAAAKLKIKRAESRGDDVDPAVRAIAEAKPIRQVVAKRRQRSA